jgi:hypothetical protein
VLNLEQRNLVVVVKKVIKRCIRRSGEEMMGREQSFCEQRKVPKTQQDHVMGPHHRER